MISICFICAIIAAASADRFAQIGPALFIAVAAHNGLGYLLGYWGSAWLGLPEQDRRTIAIEVGLQNGGLAASIATRVLHSTLIALPAALFAPWMNVTGSLLAAWWRRYPVSDDEPKNSSTDSKPEKVLETEY